MNPRKVLIITYYWPPAGGPGVQRWLKFAKYLPEFGVKPIIFTPENPSYPIIDETLSKEISADLEIVKIPIWEPYQIAEKINPNNKKYKAGQFENTQNQSFLSKLSVFIRGNFFIPDARKFWVKPSVKFLQKYLIENEIETIITTGPPHSLHLIGLQLKMKFNHLKWIADFRDPWTQISYHSQLKLTETAKNKHLELESEVLASADCVLATSYTDGENFEKLGVKKVEVLTNGFEIKEEFKNEKTKNSKFKISYSGGLEFARNPLVIWKALQDLIQTNEEFKQEVEIHFYGNLSSDVLNSIEENKLKNHFKLHGYVSHSESFKGISKADLLILTNFPDEKSKGIIPGKLFEYMATENPILAIGPDQGDVKRILNETNSGQYFTHFELDEVKEFISNTYENWKSDSVETKPKNIERFSRKNLTSQLSEIIRNL